MRTLLRALFGTVCDGDRLFGLLGRFSAAGGEATYRTATGGSVMDEHDGVERLWLLDAQHSMRRSLETANLRFWG